MPFRVPGWNMVLAHLEFFSASAWQPETLTSVRKRMQKPEEASMESDMYIYVYMCVYVYMFFMDGYPIIYPQPHSN